MPQLVNYDVSYYSKRENSPTFRAEVLGIIDCLHPRPGDRILELGCGSGAILAQLLNYNCQLLVGLDWLETSVALATGRSAIIKAISGDALRLPFGSSSFSHLVAQHLIEHFENTLQVLQEWKRVLQPSGRLVLVTPNRFFPHQEWFDDPSHCHIFSVNELIRQVESAGFLVKNAYIVNPYFFHLRFMFFSARYLQFMQHVPYFANRGMSILLSATKG